MQDETVPGEECNVRIDEQDGVRLMYLGGETVHSAMRVDCPNDLELSYTRSMMGFLLFRPEPRHVLMIGLGGGSLAKFIYHRMPQTRITVVEINPEVVAAARSHFLLPEDDERLQLIIGDAAEYVAATTDKFDVVMVDGFAAHRQVESLATEDFYSYCQKLLCADGALVVNLVSSERISAEYYERFKVVFAGQTVALPAEKRGNVILLGLDKSPGTPSWGVLQERAQQLELLYGLEFPLFIESLKKMNPTSVEGLLV